MNRVSGEHAVLLAAFAFVFGFLLGGFSAAHHHPHDTFGCWDEPNSAMVHAGDGGTNLAGFERICGQLKLMPAHSIRVDNLDQKEK